MTKYKLYCNSFLYVILMFVLPPTCVACFPFMEGLRSDESTASLISEYASLVLRPGFYLEAVDAEIFVHNTGGRLVIGVDNADMPMSLKDSADLSAHLSEDQEKEELPINRNDPLTWVLVSCNANYAPNGMKNHWVPGFFKEQIRPDEWNRLTVTEIQPLVEEYKENKIKLKKLQETFKTMEENDLGEEHYPPEAKVLLQSAITRVEEEVQKFLGSNI